MNIQKIKLVDGTLGGLKITHLVSEIKDGHTFQTPTVSEPKYPIHLGLVNKFNELRSHLLNICDICQNPHDDMEFEFAINAVDIIEIHTTPTSFRIIGNKKMTDTKIIKLKTYEVEEDDGYAHFKDVQKIIGDILTETREYVAGNKPISTEELTKRIMDNLIKKGKRSEEDFAGMTEVEKEAFCRKFFEDRGDMIITSEEIEVEGDNVVEFNAKAS